MELKEPKFMTSEFVYYDEDGVQIKDNAPEWVRKEYEEFKKNFNRKSKVDYSNKMYGWRLS